MIHLLGYGALVLNLLSMTRKKMVYLRGLSLLANAIYVVYGILLEALPIAIGCGIAVLIHGYQLISTYAKMTTDRN